MRKDEFVRINGTLTSMAACTEVSIRTTDVLVTLTRRNSPYVSHQGVAFDLPPHDGTEVPRGCVLFRNRGRWLLVGSLPTPPGRPVIDFADPEADFLAAVTPADEAGNWVLCGGPVPRTLLGPLEATVREVLGEVPWINYSPLVPVLTSRRRLVRFTSDGRPVLAGLPDPEPDLAALAEASLDAYDRESA